MIESYSLETQFKTDAANSLRKHDNNSSPEMLSACEVSHIVIKKTVNNQHVKATSIIYFRLHNSKDFNKFGFQLLLTTKRLPVLVASELTQCLEISQKGLVTDSCGLLESSLDTSIGKTLILLTSFIFIGRSDDKRV